MIEMTGLQRDFAVPGGEPVTALDGVNLLIEEGEWVSIMGRSGSGKTTLLNILGLLDTPTGGSYRLDGEDAAGMSRGRLAELRTSVFGFVFQSFHMVPNRSLLDNVELGMVYAGVPPAERRQRAAAAVSAVGLSHRTEANVLTLSGGEKQRTVIARALAGDCRILLCDEPTGNLDDRSGGVILDHIAQARQSGRTVIVVTHDPAVAARGDRVIEVSEGKVA